jgi:hypothetical protein
MAELLIKCKAVRMFIMPKTFKLGDTVYVTENELKRYRSMVQPDEQQVDGTEASFSETKPDKQYKRGRRKQK